MKPIRGAFSGGGGGGGSARTPIEYPDSLRSTQVARVIDIVSEGVIYGPPESGPVDPLHADPEDPEYKGDLSAKYIYLNDTPLMTATGEMNFSGISYNIKLGTQDQAHVGGFPGSENVISVGAEVKVATGPYIKAITDVNVNAVIVTIEYPSLTFQTSEGDITGTTAAITIEVQDGASPYEVVVDSAGGTTTGKSVGPYTRSWYVPLPGAGPWNIRVTRITADSADIKLQNKTYVQAITEVIEKKLRYPNTAYVAIRADAKQFGSVPARSYLLKGLKVQVPSNYDPETRIYTGLWDGTFQLAWTDNPVWIWYDLLTSARYGLGAHIDPEMVDKFTCYEVAKYCDEEVTDGYGGLEPRFTCNLYLGTQEDASQVVQNLASIFRGISYWTAGAFTLVADIPRDSVAVFTNANVLSDGFSYSGSARKTRHNAVAVSWNNPRDGYKLDWVYAEDTVSISQIGLRQADISALGCTSRRQALWAARAILFTERYESEVVSFKAGFEGASLRPGDLIEIYDNTRGAVPGGGRLKAGSTTTSINLDRAVTFGGGAQLMLRLGDGFVESMTLTGGSGTDTVTVSGGFTEAPAGNTAWIVREAGSEGTWRVVSVKETLRNQFDVSAIKHDPDKYDYIEGTTTLTDDPDPEYTGNVPTGLILREDVRTMPTGEVYSIITADWEPVLNAANYPLSWRKDDGNWNDVTSLANTTFEIPEPAVPGSTYRVRVASVVDSRTSRYALAQIVADGKTEAPSDVTGFTASPGLYSSELTWDANPEPDFVRYEIRQGANWAAGTTIVKDLDATKFTWQKQPADTYDLWIKAKNSSDVESTNAAGVSLTIDPEDDFITPPEKRQWKAEFDVIVSEQTDLDAQADTYGVSRTTYDTTITNLKSYLATLTGAQGWTGSPTFDWTSYTSEYYLGDATPPTTGSVFYTKFKDVWNARNALRTAITNAAAQGKDVVRWVKFWNFSKDDDSGFTVLNGTVANDTIGSVDYYTSRKFTATSTPGAFIYLDVSNERFGVPITGNQCYIGVARIKLVSGTWKGRWKYSTTAPSTHSYSDFYCKDAGAPAVGAWTEVYFDLRNLTAGGTDWVDGTIDGIRLDLAASSGSVVQVDWIGIGVYGAGSEKDTEDLLNKLLSDAYANANTNVFTGTVAIGTPANLIPNPNSELKVGSGPKDLVAAARGAVALLSSGGFAYEGTGWRSITGNGGTVEKQITELIPVVGGENLYMRAMSRLSASGGSAIMRLEAYDVDKVSLGSALDLSTTATTYTEVSGQAAVPSTARFVAVKLIASSVPGGQQARWDAMELRYAAAARLLVDGSILARHLSVIIGEAWQFRVGPLYRFYSTPDKVTTLDFKTDGGFSRPSSGETANPNDSTWYGDPTRSIPSTLPSIQASALFWNDTGNRSIVVGMSDVFATSAQSGYELRRDPVNNRFGLFAVAGVNSYTQIGSWITLTSPGTNMERMLLQVLNPASPSGSTVRMRALFDGAIKKEWTHTDLSSPGDIGGQCALRLANTSIRAGLLAMGPGNIVMEGGVILADMLEADLAIVNVIRSPNYVAGTSGAPATGFKVSGATFTVTFRTGGTASANAEFGADVSIAGFSARDVSLRAMNCIDFAYLNGSAADSAKRYYWKGNNDPSTRNGVPDITKITPYQNARYDGTWANIGGAFSKLRFQLYCTPSARSDNWDGMLSFTINLYEKSGTTLTRIDGQTVALNGRAYITVGDDGSSNNTGYMATADFVVPGNYYTDATNVVNNGDYANVVIELEVCNVYGMTSARWWAFQKSGGAVAPVDLGGSSPPTGYTMGTHLCARMGPGVGAANGGHNPSWSGQYT